MWTASKLLVGTVLTTAMSAMGRLIFEGWYADPEIRVYDNIFWVFPTTSIAFENQSYFDAWSSPDMVHWTKHSTIITNDNFWAPASVTRNGKYYLYFSANGLRTIN